MGDCESALNMSFGAGITNQIKFGIMMARNNTSPRHSKPALYFLNINFTFTNTDLYTTNYTMYQPLFKYIPHTTPL